MDCYIHDEATSPGLEGKLESVFRRFQMGLTVFALGCGC